MAVTVATPKDYWISQQALSITLNALGEPNRIQASVASGAAILCYVRGVKPASSGQEYAKNGDGLEYDNGHNYRHWPITISPTFFNSDTEKYLYIAIPRSASVGTDAMVVFPSEKLDIYGYSIKQAPVIDDEGKMHDADGNETDDPAIAVKEEQQDTLVGSENYFYIWLQGIISEPTEIDGILQRQWSAHVDCGTLSTDEAFSTLDSDWYSYSTIDQIVSFLKEILMKSGSSFINLILNHKELTDVATSKLTAPVDSDKMIATPNYVQKFFISKIKDDIANGIITFVKGIKIGAQKIFGWDENGNILANRLSLSLEAKINEIRSHNNNGSGLFESGWFVTNNHNGHSYLEIDELLVRMKAVFMELEIRKETYSGGNVFYSPAGSIIYKVECYKYDTEHPGEIIRLDADTKEIVRPFTAGGRMLALLSEKTGLFSHREVVTIQKEVDHTEVDFYRCYLIADDGTVQTRNWWRKYDQARCQTFNRAYEKNETGTSDQIDPQFDDNYVQRNMDGNRFFWRLVTNTGTTRLDDGKWYDYVDLSNRNHDEDSSGTYNYLEASGYVPGSDFPVVGDSIVCIGNRMDAERMNMIMLEVIGSDAPAIKIYRGINTFSLEGRKYMSVSPQKIQIRVGSIEYITDYGTPVPTKVWRDYWEPGIRYHYYDEVSHAGSTWLCMKDDGYHWEHANGEDAPTPAQNLIIEGEGLFAYGQSGGKELQDRYYATAVVSGETIYKVRNYTTVEPSNASATIWHKEVSAGGAGTRGAFKSRVFARTNTDISSAQYTPTGGDYDRPWPGGADGTTQHGVTWYDGIPNGSEMLWSSVCTFSDGVTPVWSRPAQETDNRTQDVEFSLSETRPNAPSGNVPYTDHSSEGWYDPSRNPTLPTGKTWNDMVWRAERKVNNGVYSGDWVITKILGEDGDPTPSYVEIQEAWSNDTTARGMPGDCVETDWKNSTPPNTNNRKYLWRRSRTRVWNPETESYTTPSWTYVRLNGTNGTSIETKGTVESTVYLLDGYVRPYINGATVPESQKVAVSDGWAYVNNSDGHLYQWSDELRTRSGSWTGWSSGWIDLGKFQGDAGATYYTHVAWGKNVIIGTPTYTPTQGQRTTPNASACEAFSPAPAEGYDFMGILIDQVSDDCTYWQNYTWKSVKGSAGPAGGSTATVYLYKRSASPVSTVGINAPLYYKFSTKKLYTTEACTTEATTQLNGWSLVIPDDNSDPIYVTAAIAYSETDIDDIGSNEWVTPAQFTENGENGINSATVFLYKRAASTPDDTNGNYKCPQQTLYYKFADGKLYKDASLTQEATKNDGLSGWELEIPTSDGNPCYVIQAAALSAQELDAIEVTKSGSTYTTNDWSGVRKLVEDGVTPTVGIDPNSKNWIINGVDTGIKAEGENGKGIAMKGVRDVLWNSEKTGNKTSLEEISSTAQYGDCYSVLSTNHLYFRDNTSTISGIPSGWLDMGEYKGEPGDSSYVHIAYATSITLSNGIVTAVTGFTVDNNGTDYDWWGFCTNNSETDPGRGASSTDVTAARNYKWNYMKGKDGNGVEYIYLLTKEDFKPAINQSSGQGTPSQGEFLPAVANYTAGKIYDNSQYWDDDPPASVSETWPALWWASRKYTYNASTGKSSWGDFGDVTLHNRWSKDGESAWVADFDNEMDSVSCDDSGYVLPTANGGSQSVGTTVNLYLGTDKVYSKIYAVSRNGSGMTNDMESYGVTASWPTAAGTDRTLTISYASTAKIDGKDDFTITITDADSANPRTLHFTVNGIKGDVYNLKPGNSSIVGTRNASNRLNITGIICGYTKRGIDGNVTTIDDAPGTHDGTSSDPNINTLFIDGKYNLWYHKRLRSTGDWEKYESGGTSVNAYQSYHWVNPSYPYSGRPGIVENFDPNTYDAVEFILCTEVGNYRARSSGELLGIVDREIVPVVADGATGATGVRGDFKSTVFKRTNTTPVATPTGGSYDTPWPGGVEGTDGWYDGIPNGEAILWASTRTFYGDGRNSVWSTPKQMTDTADFDVEFSSVETNPGNPTDNPSNWSNTASSTTIWMATREKHNGVWGSWQIAKIKGEKGDSIDPDDPTVIAIIDGAVRDAASALKDGLTIVMKPQVLIYNQDDKDAATFSTSSTGQRTTVEIYRGDNTANFTIVQNTVMAYGVASKGSVAEMRDCAGYDNTAKTVWISNVAQLPDSTTGNYKYAYDHGYIEFTVTVDPGTSTAKSYVLQVSWYLNRLGNRELITRGDFETEIMSRTEYSIESEATNLLLDTKQPDKIGTRWSIASGNGSIVTVTDSPVSGYTKAFRVVGLSGFFRYWQQTNTFWRSDDVYKFGAYVRGIGGNVTGEVFIYEADGDIRSYKTFSVGTSWTYISFEIDIHDFEEHYDSHGVLTSSADFRMGISGAGTIEFIAPILCNITSASVIRADYEGKIESSASGIEETFTRQLDGKTNNSDFTSLQNDYATYKRTSTENISALQSTTASQGTSITNLNQSVSTAQSSISTLQTTVAGHTTAISTIQQTSDAISMGVSNGWKNYVENPIATEGSIGVYNTQSVVEDSIFGGVVQISNITGGDWQLKHNIDASYVDLTGKAVTWFCVIKNVGYGRVDFGSGSNETTGILHAIRIQSTPGAPQVTSALNTTYYQVMGTGVISAGGAWYICYVSAKAKSDSRTIIDGLSSRTGAVGFNCMTGTWQIYYAGIVMGSGCPSLDMIKQGAGVKKAGIDIERGIIRLDAEKTVVTGNLQARGIDTQEVAGHRIHIEGGTFDVYDNNGNVGLRIGWDDSDNGAPYIILCNGDGTKSYKLTYDGVKTATGTYTQDNLTNTSLRLNLPGSASAVNSNTNAVYYYKYSASKNEITGAYSRQNPTSSSIYDDSWAELRAQYNNRWFNTTSVSNVLQANTDYIIADGYYISSSGSSRTVNSKTVYARTLYTASGGVLSNAGTAYYYLDSSIGMWCDINGLNGQKMFDANRYIKPSRE